MLVDPYCKLGQLLQRKSIHLRDTMVNVEPYLLIAEMLLESEVI